MKTAALALALSFCATAAVGQTFGQCMDAGTASAAVRPLDGKLAVTGGARGTTFLMMTIAEKPTSAEQIAIASWAEIYSACMKADTAWRSSLPADAAAVLEAVGNGLIALAARLYSGELTYGQFNTQRSEMGQRADVALASIRQREEARAQASNDAEMQARRAAALQYIMGQQPAFRPYQAPALPAPIPPTTTTTNCHRFGDQVTCTTR